ncbi:MAG: hypothetical protein WB819_00195, partial [Terriglobia bacterium]
PSFRGPMSLIGPRNLHYFQCTDQKQIPLPLCGIGIDGVQGIVQQLVEKFPAVVDGHRRMRRNGVEHSH